MTTSTIQPHHVPIKGVGLALGGAVLAAAAGYGVAALVLDDAPLSAPTTSIGTNDSTGNDVDRYPGFDPNGYAGTDREDRAFQHRR